MLSLFFSSSPNCTVCVFFSSFFSFLSFQSDLFFIYCRQKEENFSSPFLAMSSFFSSSTFLSIPSIVFLPSLLFHLSLLLHVYFLLIFFLLHQTLCVILEHGVFQKCSFFDFADVHQFTQTSFSADSHTHLQRYTHIFRDRVDAAPKYIKV